MGLGSGDVFLEHLLKLILSSPSDPLHIPADIRSIPILVHD
jgi:hypothetical protein